MLYMKKIKTHMNEKPNSALVLADVDKYMYR